MHFPSYNLSIDAKEITVVEAWVIISL